MSGQHKLVVAEPLYLLQVSVAVAPDCVVDADWKPSPDILLPTTGRDFLDMLGGEPQMAFFLGGVGLGEHELVVTPYIPDSRSCGDDILDIRLIG